MAGGSGAKPGDQLSYWARFEVFLRDTGNSDIVLRTHPGGHKYFRIVEIEGVSEPNRFHRKAPHFAVVAAKRGNKKKQRFAGNRVQLVLPDRRLYGALLEYRPSIDRRIPEARWVPPDDRDETGHIEVWKKHNLPNPDAWDDDFAWLLRNTRLFQRELGDYARGTA